MARLSRDTNCIAVGGRPCGSRYSARLGRLVVSRDRRDTAQEAPRYGRAWPATRHLVSHDTTQRAPRHCTVHAAWALCARSKRATKVHSVCTCAPNPVWT